MTVTSHRTHPSHQTARRPLGYILQRKCDGDYDDFCVNTSVPRHHWYKSADEAWVTLYEDTNEDAETLRQLAESYEVVPIYLDPPAQATQPNSAADADMPAAVKYVADTLAELEWLTHAAAELMRGSSLTAKERDAIQDPLDSAYMAVFNSLGTIAENATAGRQMPCGFDEIGDRLQALSSGVDLPEPARTNVTAGINKALAAVQDIALKQ